MEIGCGSGRMLKSMQEKGWDVVGVDPDPIAIKNVNRRDLFVIKVFWRIKICV